MNFNKCFLFSDVLLHSILDYTAFMVTRTSLSRCQRSANSLWHVWSWCNRWSSQNQLDHGYIDQILDICGWNRTVGHFHSNPGCGIQRLLHGIFRGFDYCTSGGFTLDSSCKIAVSGFWSEFQIGPCKFGVSDELQIQMESAFLRENDPTQVLGRRWKYSLFLQMSFTLWRFMLFMYWMILTGFSIVIMLLIYTYQFADVPVWWKNLTHWPDTV